MTLRGGCRAASVGPGLVDRRLGVLLGNWRARSDLGSIVRRSLPARRFPVFLRCAAMLQRSLLPWKLCASPLVPARRMLLSGLFMGTVVTVHPLRSEASQRGARMLRTALGPSIAAWLEEPR